MTNDLKSWESKVLIYPTSSNLAWRGNILMCRKEKLDGKYWKISMLRIILWGNLSISCSSGFNLIFPSGCSLWDEPRGHFTLKYLFSKLDWKQAKSKLLQCLKIILSTTFPGCPLLNAVKTVKTVRGEGVLPTALCTWSLPYGELIWNNFYALSSIWNKKVKNVFF